MNKDKKERSCDAMTLIRALASPRELAKEVVGTGRTA
jgi:hypothetical protein